MLKKIAVTGGVGSGKTTVCRIFEKLGASVIFTDQIVHQLLSPATEIGKKVLELFGSNLMSQGKIDRKALGKQVFQDQKKLQMLEALLHPAVLQQIEREYTRAKGNCFVVEIPLLYEIGAEDFYDVVIAVISDEPIAKKRFALQGFDETEFGVRMKRQKSLKEKAARADYTLTNNGSLEELESEVIRVQRKILSI